MNDEREVVAVIVCPLLVVRSSLVPLNLTPISLIGRCDKVPTEAIHDRRAIDA